MRGEVKPLTLLFAALFALPATCGEFVIAERGGSVAPAIAVFGETDATLDYAADELRDYIRKLTGVTPVVGTTERATVVLASGGSGLGPDGFRLRVDGDRLTITGGSSRGTLYGVYEVLERFGGVGFYASWRTVVPEADRFAVPDDLDETQEPAFEIRAVSWSDPCGHQDFAAKLRSTATGWFEEDPKYGGSAPRFVDGLGNCHTFRYLVPVETYFAEHPEYFSEIGGVRRDGRTQLCLTNPDVLRIVVSNVLEKLSADPSAKFVGVSQNDWYNYCECATCKAVDDEEESHAGTMIRFVNAVAEEVEKVRPDVLVETLAYQYTRKPPKKTRPRHNVVPCLCSIECSFSRPLADAHDWWNRDFMDDLNGWSAICDRLYVWNYTTDFLYYLNPTPNDYNFAADLRTFRAHNVRYVFEEGCARIGDFGSLKPWLLAKLLWNPDLETRPLIERFIRGYYGAAAPWVQAYFDDVHYHARPWCAGSFRADGYRLAAFEDDREDVYPDDFLWLAIEDFKKAEAAVSDDPALLVNVRTTELSPVCTLLIRKARTAKWAWVTRNPERFADGSRYRELYDWLVDVMKMSTGWTYGRSVTLGNTDQLHAWYMESIRRMVESQVPAAGSDRALLGAADIRFYSAKHGEVVDDASAESGKAILVRPDSNGECVGQMSMGNVAYDADGLYTVRIRVRVDKSANGKGEAFLATFGGDEIAPRAEDVGDGYVWYEFLERELADGLTFNFAGGRYANGGGTTAVRGVYLDEVEIVRTGTKSVVTPTAAVWPPDFAQRIAGRVAETEPKGMSKVARLVTVDINTFAFDREASAPFGDEDDPFTSIWKTTKSSDVCEIEWRVLPGLLLFLR